MKGFEPGQSDKQVRSAVDPLLALKPEALSDAEVLAVRTGQAGGRSLNEMHSLMSVLRKTGENPEVLASIGAKLTADIAPDELKPKMEIRQESQDRLEAIKIQKAQLADRKLTLDEAAARGKKSTLTGQKKDRQQIALQEQRLSVEAERLSRDLVEVDDPKRARLQKLNAIPKEKRALAFLEDTSLLDPESKAKGTFIAESMKALQKNPVEGLLSTNQRAIEGMSFKDKTAIGDAQHTAYLDNLQKDIEGGKGPKKPETEDVIFDRLVREQVVNDGGGSLAQARGYARRITRFMGDAGLDRAVEERNQKENKALLALDPGHSMMPPKSQRVILEADESKINRVEPARNGGN